MLCGASLLISMLQRYEYNLVIVSINFSQFKFFFFQKELKIQRINFLCLNFTGIVVCVLDLKCVLKQYKVISCCNHLY